MNLPRSEFQLVQVVLDMETFHTDMGSVLVLLHTPRVWILQRPPREPLPPRHRWSVRLSHRHCRSLLRRLS